MNIKREKIGWIIGGFIACSVSFISITTWLYPYSPFSVNKSYIYQRDKVLFNDKSYKEILYDFKNAYEKDLNNEYLNLTVNRTQYVLPIFEQDWLISEDSVSIDAKQLDMMLWEVKQVREVLLNLVVEEDYASEQRDYLMNIIKKLLSLEESIIDLKNENYVSRSELNRRLNTLCRDFTSVFRLYIAFYDRATNK